MLSNTKQSFEARSMPSWMNARTDCGKSLGLEELNGTRGGWEGELSLRLTPWLWRANVRMRWNYVLL